ncbi:MAG: 50S ribosomal protein L11 methyltransferase [bacterium]
MRDRAAFITRNLTLQTVEGVALYQAHARSRLSRLGDVPPYWAYVWAGGAALARHVTETGMARGQRVLDFGAGSGIVGIAAAKAGAAEVWADEPDPWARAAIGLNAAANAVAVGFGAAPVDLLLCGDVFYSADVAATVLPVLDDWRARGIPVLIGDPGRAALPRTRLHLVAEYSVHDMGDAPDKLTMTGVYDYQP